MTSPGFVRTRFAPSPNGSLHLGHAHAAIVAHDLARASGGDFLVRIEDIDGTRSRVELADEFFADLAWLGLSWDEAPAYQSERVAGYIAAGERLKQLGLLYPCTCTRAQVAAAATAYGPDGPIYAGTCRHLLGQEGDHVAWRIDMARAMAMAGPLQWQDQLAGLQQASAEMFGDVVLLRKEAPASYHLAATLDDAAQGISLVTRGKDLFLASHIHRLLQALLELPVPTWHHHALLMDEDDNGKWRKLAKRRGSAAAGYGLAEMRRAGQDGHALADNLRAQKFMAGISLVAGLKDKT